MGRKKHARGGRLPALRDTSDQDLKRVVVIGSDEWENGYTVTGALQWAVMECLGGNATVVQGGTQRIADLATRLWCDRSGIPTESRPPAYRLWGPAARARSLHEILATEHVDLCLGFLDGRDPTAAQAIESAETMNLPTMVWHASP